MAKIGFGGGCHWCTEAVFQSLKGVQEVHQGFIKSDPPHDGFSEAVEVVFDPNEIPVEALVKVHVATHASASAHKVRGKYRSAIYVRDLESQKAIQLILRDLEAETGVNFVTTVLFDRGFKPSDERFHNYHLSGPERPFCKTYIDPKLAKLRRDFSPLLKTDMIKA